MRLTVREVWEVFWLDFFEVPRGSLMQSKPSESRSWPMPVKASHWTFIANLDQKNRGAGLKKIVWIPPDS